MFFSMNFQSAFRPKRIYAGWMLTDEFVHSAVHHQEVVYHSIMKLAVDEADWARGFPRVRFHVLEQMHPEVLVRILVCKHQITDAAVLLLKVDVKLARRVFFSFDLNVKRFRVTIHSLGSEACFGGAVRFGFVDF